MDILARDYRRHGYVVLPGVMPDAWCRELYGAAIAMRSEQFRVDRYVQENDRLMTKAGPYRYWAFGLSACDRMMPELRGAYIALRPLVEMVARVPVVLSPHGESAITVKVYGPEDWQTWHCDTNGITALLYLTNDNQAGRTVIYEDLAGRSQVAIRPVRGALLLMQGRKLLHMAEKPRGYKAVVALNYYDARDTSRPEGVDAIVYGDGSGQ